MTRVTHYNTYGTRESRVVASYVIESTDEREVMRQAGYRAALWNKDETRENMRVNFIGCNGRIRTA